MSSTSNYSPNLTCVPGRNVSLTNLNVCSDAAVQGNLNVNTINNLPYPPPPGQLPSLVSNKLLRTTMVPPLSMYWGDITTQNITAGPTDTAIYSDGTNVSWSKLPPDTLTPGTTNQILTMTSAPQWSSSLDIPLTLTVEGSTLLKSNTQINQTLQVTQNISSSANIIATGDISTVLGNMSASNVTATNLLTSNTANITNTLTSAITNITGNLKMNGTSGSLNQVLTKTSATTQSWLLPYQIRLVRYAAYFAQQDFNAAAGPTAVVFDTVNTISNLAVNSIGSITGISQPSTTQFKIGATATYDIQITGFLDPASAGLTNSAVTLSLEVSGTEIAQSAVVLNTLSFVGAFSSIAITANANVRLLARRTFGVNALSNFGPTSAVPNYRSVITFSLVNTVSP